MATGKFPSLDGDNRIKQKHLPMYLIEPNLNTHLAEQAEDPASPLGTALSATYGRGVSVTAFGAKGDGVTNDDAAIKAAQAATRPGETLYFPAGTYRHPGLGTVRSGEIWELEPGATLKLLDGANNHSVVVTHDKFTLRGGVIDGNRANQSAASWYGVFISAAHDATVYGVTVRSIQNRGIYSRNSNRTTIDTCQVSDVGENAIYVEPTTTATAPVLDPVVRNCRVDRTAEPTGTIGEGGIKIHGNSTSNQKVLRARIQNNTVLLPTMASAGTPQICIEIHTNTERAIISGNTCSGGTMGISVDFSAYAVVTGNSASGFSYYGIEWAASPDGTCGNNNIDGSGLGVVGIVQTTSGSFRTTITGNTIRGVTQDGISTNVGNDSTISTNNITLSTGARHGINIGGGQSGLTITGNSINTSAANYGINVAPACQYLTITGNNINGNSVALKGIAIERSLNLVVNSNTIRNFTQHGIFIYAFTSYILDQITVFGNDFAAVGTPFAFGLSNGGATGVNILLGQTRYGITLPQATTPGRPSATSAGVGASFYDKTLSKPIWSDGSVWKDATGTAV